MSRPNDIASKGRCEELRKHVRLQAKARGLSIHAFGKYAGLTSGTFAPFMAGRPLRSMNEAKLARALGLAPADRPALPPALPAPQPAETRPLQFIGDDGGQLPESPLHFSEQADPMDNPMPTPTPNLYHGYLGLSDTDKGKVRAIFRAEQGDGPVSALCIRLGLGPTVLHGFMRGKAGMSPEMANKLLEKLGRPERFVGTVPRNQPSKKRKSVDVPLERPVNKSVRVGGAQFERVRAQLERYVQDLHHGSQYSAATTLGVAKSTIFRLLSGKSHGLRLSTLELLEQQLSAPPRPNDGRLVPKKYLPVPPPNQQLALALPQQQNGHAPSEGMAPRTQRLFTEFLPQAAPLAEKTVEELVARWQREAFALVLSLSGLVGDKT